MPVTVAADKLRLDLDELREIIRVTEKDGG